MCEVDVNPCMGCVKCGYEEPCIQKDDIDMIRKKILSSDMLAFATPLYYYGMTAQLKTVIDRFCAYNISLRCGTVAMTEKSIYLEQAYQLGKIL